MAKNSWVNWVLLTLRNKICLKLKINNWKATEKSCGREDVSLQRYVWYCLLAWNMAHLFPLKETVFYLLQAVVWLEEWTFPIICMGQGFWSSLPVPMLTGTLVGHSFSVPLSPPPLLILRRWALQEWPLWKDQGWHPVQRPQPQPEPFPHMITWSARPLVLLAVVRWGCSLWICLVLQPVWAVSIVCDKATNQFGIVVIIILALPLGKLFALPHGDFTRWPLLAFVVWDYLPLHKGLSLCLDVVFSQSQSSAQNTPWAATVSC